jgi:hypothetical protein
MMRRVRTARFLLVAMAATALIAAAGCGGEDEAEKEEYAAEVESVLEPLDAELQEIGDTVTGAQDIDDVAVAVDAFESEIRETIDELRAIEPPAEVQEAHRRLIDAFTSFNSAVTRLAEAAQSGSSVAVVAAAARLQLATGTLKSQLGDAEQLLEDAGIDVSG